MALYLRKRSFLFGYQEGTDTSTKILGAIYAVTKSIRHNPSVSPHQIISDHGFCGYPWLFRTERGPFSLAVKE